MVEFVGEIDGMERERGVVEVVVGSEVDSLVAPFVGGVNVPELLLDRFPRIGAASLERETSRSLKPQHVHETSS